MTNRQRTGAVTATSQWPGPEAKPVGPLNANTTAHLQPQAGRRAVIKSSCVIVCIAVPITAKRASHQAVCLCIAALGPDVRFCRQVCVG
jgi:hypothetical protein